MRTAAGAHIWTARSSQGWLALCGATLVVLMAAACAPAPAPGGPATPSAAPAQAALAPVPSPSPAAAGGAVEVVKAVHVPSVLFAPLYVALDRGYFRDQGIDLQLDRAAAGQDANVLLANGQLDVLVGGFSAATFAAISRGIDMRVVSSMGRQPQQGYPSALMVRSDLLQSGAVRSMADLKGRKVAISGGLGATGSYWVATKLREANLTLKDIEVVNLGFPEMVVAFQTQAIDAAYPSAPATTQIKNAGTADYFGGLTAPGASAVGTTFGGAFIKNRPEVARRVLVALVRGARDVQGANYFSPQNLRAYETYTATPVATLQTMDAYDFDPNLAPDTHTLEDMQHVFIDQGILQLPAPLPANEYVDAAFQQAAVQALR